MASSSSEMFKIRIYSLQSTWDLEIMNLMCHHRSSINLLFRQWKSSGNFIRDEYIRNHVFESSVPIIVYVRLRKCDILLSRMLWRASLLWRMLWRAFDQTIYCRYRPINFILRPDSRLLHIILLRKSPKMSMFMSNTSN